MARLFALILPDRFIPILLGFVALAILLPARGMVLGALSTASLVAIVTLFFVHGARLSRQSVIGGMTRLRLHLTVLAAVFLLFPLIGLALSPLARALAGEDFAPGFLFLCALPTTVATSIAMVSMARGNVAATVIAAALSSMAGVLLTPLIFAALFATAGGSIDPSGIFTVILILALPFAIGQLCRPIAGAWIEARPGLSRLLDRVTIILAVYVALSAAANSGLFDDIAAAQFAGLLGAALLLLLAVILAALLAGRITGFDHGDRMVLLFAMVQKSVIAGTPMARVLFPGAEAGLIILPLLVYYVPMVTVTAIMASRIGAGQGAE